MRIFSETGSGKSTKKRDEPHATLKYLNTGDTLMVWRLDRLGRNVVDLIELVGGLQECGIEFRSLTESVNTSTSGGRLVFHIFAALAQMERELISERTKAGLAAARKQGRTGGRPPVLTQEQIAGQTTFETGARPLHPSHEPWGAAETPSPERLPKRTNSEARRYE